ncbi:hypothetical protein L228DRAFT_250184 [Xylona heveae TC161]|uniref:Uncharacterized protein n=1 Tax=Xylona heveae (strain CBS 132557 / TC161) TaxID=1328760 RepID=A0A165AHH8_XYLHT|nr:hypothetical protein L228DRAFT_250184 [Xylona heveae TC161]KZF20483.1 hypothetical protein L228DRAFT_250184 [Xylona heveae TC161]
MEDRMASRSRNGTNDDSNQPSIWVDELDNTEASNTSYDEMDYVPTTEEDDEDEDDESHDLDDDDDDDEYHGQLTQSTIVSSP